MIKRLLLDYGYSKIGSTHVGKFRCWIANVLYLLLLITLDQTQDSFELDMVDAYYEDTTVW
jgi:hypothetical protein